MQKLILVFYIDMRTVDPKKQREYLNECAIKVNKMKSLHTDEMICLTIPHMLDNKVECINPKLISEDEYKNNILPLIEKANKTLENFDK